MRWKIEFSATFERSHSLNGIPPLQPKHGNDYTQGSTVSQPKRHPVPATTIDYNYMDPSSRSHSLNGIPPLQLSTLSAYPALVQSHSLNGIPPLQPKIGFHLVEINGKSHSLNGIPPLQPNENRKLGKDEKSLTA